MLNFIARRLVVAMFQLVGLVLVVFFAIRMLPADPVARLVGMNASTPRPTARRSRRSGSTSRCWSNSRIYISASQGRLRPLVGDRRAGDGGDRNVLPITLELITISFILAFLIAVPFGMLCALRPGGVADTATFTYSLFAGSQPEFWWGLLFIYIFFAMLGWAPPPLGRLDPMSTPPAPITGFITIDSLIAGNIGGVSRRPASPDAAGADEGVRAVGADHQDGAPEHGARPRRRLHPLRPRRAACRRGASR